jgi:Fe-Mn family superoxide dismutase
MTRDDHQRGFTRRQALHLLGAAPLGVAAVLDGGIAMATEEPTTRPAAYRGEHRLKPLPFDPARLKGLSERLITSHHQNNYGGAVKRLNLIEQQLGALPKDAVPYQMGSLKREELVARNSMVLHEAYFGNLGGTGPAEGSFAAAVKAAYGSVEAWEREFRLTGMSLGGGSGWVITCFEPSSGAVHNWWAFDHTHGVAAGVPVLVMDMYEHGYHIDYGANARGYVDAFFQNIHWDEVNRRVEVASSQRLRPN